jgi:hypothetical protein
MTFVPIWFVRLWVMRFCIRMSVDQFILWYCGLWHSVPWQMCTNLVCEIVGYDILYKDECGPVYFVRLWVMTFCAMTNVYQFSLWDCGLWHSVQWQIWTSLFWEILGYDTLYTDEFGPFHVVSLWFMISCILASVSQIVFWTAQLRHSICCKMGT